MAEKRYFVIKTALADKNADVLDLRAQKTMYRGKEVAAGDSVFVFDSENEGGHGLLAEGIVSSARATPRKAGVPRQTPRVSVTIQIKRRARKPLGRDQLKPFSNWTDGKPQTELNFKFYRQATNKLCSISPETAAFLAKFF